MSSSELTAATGNISIDCKEAILHYLKSAQLYAYGTGILTDAFSKEPVSKVERYNNSYSDGEYEWYDSEIYHFEKYNLKLNNDFIQHVLNRP